MADRRAEIIQAALSLLREEGTKGLSQPQVAKRAGIPQGHLTYYFPRKADLVAAVARQLQQEMHAGFFALLARVQPADTRVATAEILTELLLDTERTRAILGLTIESERDAEVHDVLLEIVRQGRPLFAALLGPRGDDDTIDLAQAAIWGLQLQQLFLRRERAAVRPVVERLLDFFEAPRAGRKRIPSRKKGRGTE